MEKTSNLNNGLLWFGAAVSIAEIITGALIAPLGMAKGLLAITLGHLIGIFLLYFAGMIGGKTKLPTIESSRISFGKYGSYGFSLLNILQLVGWTAVMIISGATVLNEVTKSMFSFDNISILSLIIGVLIGVWILIGIKKLGKVNIVVISALFILSVVLGVVVFSSKGAGIVVDGKMSFGAALELSIAMPLSWLPLIGDYTRYAKNPKQATWASSISYFVGSMLMYVIGLGAAIFSGTSDIASILLKAGLGVVALIIVLMSTVTTTFLDAYSAGVSFTNLTKKVDEKVASLVVCVIGTIIAIFTPITQYENFLYLIGSVFAPMISILIADIFILKKEDLTKTIDIKNLIIWLVGFVIYRVFMRFDLFLGSTIPVIIIVIAIVIGVNKLCSKKS